MSENKRQNDDQDENETARSLFLRVPQDIALAFALLTRIPIPAGLFGNHSSISQAAWAFPLVGVVIGIIGALTYNGSQALGLDTAISVVITTMVLVIATGALHEDGLADFFDGIGGGQSKQQRLEIMRDSRIGTYGMLALGFTIVLQVLLLISLAAPTNPWTMWNVFISVCTIARSSILIPMSLLKPARHDGLGAQAGSVSQNVLLVGTFMALGVTLNALGPTGAALAISGALVMTSLVCLLAHRYFGGQTGDVLGATASLSAFGALAALTIGAAVLSSASGALP